MEELQEAREDGDEGRRRREGNDKSKWKMVRDRGKSDRKAWWWRTKRRPSWYEIVGGGGSTTGRIISTSVPRPPAPISSLCATIDQYGSSSVCGSEWKFPLSFSLTKLIIRSSGSLSVCFIPFYSPLLHFISEYSLIPLFPWLYARVMAVYDCVRVCSKGAWRAAHTKLSRRSFFVFFCWWETAGYERERMSEKWRAGYKCDKGKADGEHCWRWERERGRVLEKRPRMCA